MIDIDAYFNGCEMHFALPAVPRRGDTVHVHPSNMCEVNAEEPKEAVEFTVGDVGWTADRPSVWVELTKPRDTSGRSVIRWEAGPDG